MIAACRQSEALLCTDCWSCSSEPNTERVRKKKRLVTMMLDTLKAPEIAIGLMFGFAAALSVGGSILALRLQRVEFRGIKAWFK